MGDIRSRAAFASLLCRSSVLYCLRKLVARLSLASCTSHRVGWRSPGHCGERPDSGCPCPSGGSIAPGGCVTGSLGCMVLVLIFCSGRGWLEVASRKREGRRRCSSRTPSRSLVGAAVGRTRTTCTLFGRAWVTGFSSIGFLLKRGTISGRVGFLAGELLY